MNPRAGDWLQTFAPPEAFRDLAGDSYELLPFRFLRLDGERYLATNFAGEFFVLQGAAIRDLVSRRLPRHGDLYNELKSRHFLFDGDSRVAIDLLACQYRTRQASLPQATSLFMFVVSLRCEHACPYCQVSRRSQDVLAFNMSRDVAAKGIDLVFESPARDVKIEFQGGEPLLNFELVRWIVETASARNSLAGKNLAFVIATNLALLTDDVLDFCKDNDVAISTSLDGPRELHNANRPRPGGDSHELAVQGIERAQRALGVDRVSALMTTTRRSLDHANEIVDEYVARGLRSIFVRPMSPFGFAVKTGAVREYEVDEWIAFYKACLSRTLAAARSFTPIREEYAALVLRKLLTPYPTHYVDLMSPAGLGIAGLVVNYDGDVYASDEGRMLAESGDKTFRLGRVGEQALKEFLTSESLLGWLDSTMTESAPMCADCGVQPYCGSDPVFHHATQGDVVGFKPTSDFCRRNMEIVKHLVRLLEDDPIAALELRRWTR